MVNKVFLVGNLGQDPEVRSTAGGTTVCSLSIATSERRKVGGEWQDHTEWHKVVVWGHQAEACGKFLAKGRQVYVEGRLQTRKWQDKEGKDRYTTEVVADDVKFLGGAPAAGSGERQARDTGRGTGANSGGDVNPDDIPY